MPGLFGAVKFDLNSPVYNSDINKCLQRMQDKLTHRETYHIDEWSIRNEGIAVRRIGHKNLFLYNANISSPGLNELEAFAYGIAENRINGNEKNQVDRLKKISGFFSLTYYDRQSSEIVIATDKRASEPIFYFQINGVLYFAPEVKALLEIDGIVKTPSYSAIASMFSMGHLLNNQTLFNGIKKLPGGHALIIKNGAILEKEYWRFEPGVDSSHYDIDELKYELSNKVFNCVKKHFKNNSKDIIFLSGGIDSRAILGAALEEKRNKSKVNTVSWGINQDEFNSDQYIAAKLAKDNHLNHIFMRRDDTKYGEWFENVNYLIDANSDIVTCHPYEYTIMETLYEQGYRKVLRGDEIFGWGGKVYDLTGALSKVNLRPFCMINKFSQFFHPEIFKKLCEADLEEYKKIEKDCSGMSSSCAKDYLYFNHRLQTYLGTACYYKQIVFDHRNPLLDDDILDYLRNIPDKLRINKKLFKDALLSRYPQLFKYPIAKQSGLEKWGDHFKSDTPLRKYVETQISDKDSRVWDYFKRESIKQLFTFSCKERTWNFNFSKKTQRSIVRTGKKFMGYVSPSVMAKMEAQRGQCKSPSDIQLIRRFLVLKHWCDIFL